MEPDLSVLGNAAAVPIVIALTQFLKKSFNFNRSSDVTSLAVSLLVCWGWEFYHTSEGELMLVWGLTLVSKLKHTMELVIISFATWLSASKSYDLFVGDKKRAAVVGQQLQEKEELQKEVELLRKSNGKSESEPMEEDVDLDARLRAILEGTN